MSFILGVHAKKVSSVLDTDKAAQSIEEAILRDINYYGLNAVQIFTHGPRIYTKNLFNPLKIKKACLDIALSVHSTYPSVGIWKLTKDNITHGSGKKVYAHMEDQFKSCRDIGACGLVIHISKRSPKVIANVVKTILKPLSIKYNVITLLEMVASKAATDTYETPNKINHLTNLIGHDMYWGWVIDTAHIWGAGINIQTKKQMSEWLGKISNPNKIYMIHLNGSSAECGSGHDKHEVVFGPDDKIWNNIEPTNSGVEPIIKFAIKHSVTIICEINRGAQKDIEKGINILKKLAGL